MPKYRVKERVKERYIKTEENSLKKNARGGT
jgi:hypothetical protein